VTPPAESQSLVDALARGPANARLRFECAQALKAAGDVNGAVRMLADGVRLAPRDAERWLALAGLLMEIELASPAGRVAGAAQPLARAIEALEQAVALAPGASAVLAQAAMTLRYACSWAQADALVARLVAIGGDASRRFAVSPMLATALLDDPSLQRRAITDFAATLPSAPARPPAYVREPGSRLRVGYLSADFHEHATAHLCAGLFEAHDRKRVTTFAYALDRDDGSAMRRRLVAAFAHWRELRTQADDAAAGTIARDRLDVLVDLKGHTQGSRIGILACRPAPLQVHYLGFPGTLAHAAIDAQIGDDVVVPPGDERHYAERVLRMPVCYQVNDRRRPLPPAMARSTAGVPEHAIVLASFNQAYKLTKPFVDAWLDALARHARAVLWLNVPHALSRENLRKAAIAAGVAPERIVFAGFAPQAEHLARLRCADLALDVLPYGSHTTGSDALWCGVPLLTLTGRTFAGRVGTSLVRAAGVPELATATMDAYRAALDALVGDPGRLGDYKARLERERLDVPLFDTARFTRDFEALLERAATSATRAR
jgi:predicted O-linked N-acetylglucosamine transferase (SPINDLY family)